MFTKEELLVIEDALKIADEKYIKLLDESKNNKNKMVAFNRKQKKLWLVQNKLNKILKLLSPPANIKNIPSIELEIKLTKIVTIKNTPIIKDNSIFLSANRFINFISLLASFSANKSFNSFFTSEINFFIYPPIKKGSLNFPFFKMLFLILRKQLLQKHLI